MPEKHAKSQSVWVSHKEATGKYGLNGHSLSAWRTFGCAALGPRKNPHGKTRKGQHNGKKPGKWQRLKAKRDPNNPHFYLNWRPHIKKIAAVPILHNGLHKIGAGLDFRDRVGRSGGLPP